jgi:hypothetical protein
MRLALASGTEPEYSVGAKPTPSRYEVIGAGRMPNSVLQAGDEFGHDFCCWLSLRGQRNALTGPQ